MPVVLRERHRQDRPARSDDAARSPNSRCPIPRRRRSASPSAPTAICGSREKAANKIGRITLARRDRGIPAADAEGRPRRHDPRARRQCLVLRNRSEPDRPHHAERRHHRIPGRHLARARGRSRSWCATACCGSAKPSGNRIGRITLDGKVTEFPIPSHDSQPRAMVTHPDGSIWFVETSTNALGRIDRDGKITEHPVPTPNSSLRGVTVGRDGNLWYTANAANKIGCMTPSGKVLGEYPIPTPASGARCIASMSDGRLFFTQWDAGLIGEVRGSLTCCKKRKREECHDRYPARACLRAPSPSLRRPRNAQTYPDKPIRMIVSIAAGSVTDVIMRAAANELQPRLEADAGDREPGRRRRHPRRAGLRARGAGRLHHLRHLSLDDVVQSAAVHQAAVQSPTPISRRSRGCSSSPKACSRRRRSA